MRVNLQLVRTLQPLQLVQTNFKHLLIEGKYMITLSNNPPAPLHRRDSFDDIVPMPEWKKKEQEAEVISTASLAIGIAIANEHIPLARENRMQQQALYVETLVKQDRIKSQEREIKIANETMDDIERKIEENNPCRHFINACTRTCSFILASGTLAVIGAAIGKYMLKTTLATVVGSMGGVAVACLGMSFAYGSTASLSRYKWSRLNTG